ARQVADVLRPVPLERVRMVHRRGRPQVRPRRRVRVGATLAPDPENRWGRGTRVLEQLESREPPAGAEGRRVPLYHNELPPGGRGEQALAIVAVRHLQRVVVDPGRVLSKAVVAKHDPTRAGWTQARPGP